MIIKKIKDSELQAGVQKTKIQVRIYTHKNIIIMEQCQKYHNYHYIYVILIHIVSQELESQISSFQEKCSSQMVKIADLEGAIDTLRFESSNQGLISSLQTRLSAASKQIDQLRILLADKEKDLMKVS